MPGTTFWLRWGMRIMFVIMVMGMVPTVIWLILNHLDGSTEMHMTRIMPENIMSPTLPPGMKSGIVFIYSFKPWGGATSLVTGRGYHKTVGTTLLQTRYGFTVSSEGREAPRQDLRRKQGIKEISVSQGSLRLNRIM